MIFGWDARLGCCFRPGHRNSLAWVDYSLEIAAVKESSVIAKTRSPNARRTRCPEGETASGSLILRRFSSGFFGAIAQVSQSNRLVLRKQCCLGPMARAPRAGRSRTEDRAWSSHPRHKLDRRPKDIHDNRPLFRGAL